MVCAVLAVVGIASSATTRTIELVTADFGAPAQGPRISDDGRVVAFTTAGVDVPFAAPGSSGAQIYLRDLGTSEIEQVSVASDETGRGSNAYLGGVSGDGNRVVFVDDAPYVSEDSIYGLLDVYVRDRAAGTTELVSVADAGGVGGNAGTSFGGADISADGRYVAFSSAANNLVPVGQDTGFDGDIFVRDLQAQTTTLLTVAVGGGEANGDSVLPRISDDGSTVAFRSDASNLVVGDTNGQADFFTVDVQTGSIERVSVSDDEQEASGAQTSGLDINGDGSVVAFTSLASNLVPGDTNGVQDAFVRDRPAGTTTRVSVSSSGAQSTAANYAAADVAISNDGTKVVFAGVAQLTPDDTNPWDDVYVRDLTAQTTERVSVATSGDTDNASGTVINGPAAEFDGSGDVVAFGSYASNLVTGDSDGSTPDIFVARPASADSDGDGIADDVDALPNAVSTAFDDHQGAYGFIQSVPVGFTVEVSDSLDPGEGLRFAITGSGTQKVALRMCGFTTPWRLSPGEYDLGCGSVIVRVTTGSASYETPGALVSVTLGEGSKVEVTENANGSITVDTLAGPPVVVVVDGVSGSVGTDDPPWTASSLDFQGFFQPVDNSSPPSSIVLNEVKAGQVIPFKWRLMRADGTPMTTLTVATITSQNVSCGLATSTDPLEQAATVGSGLQNLGQGNYQINQKSEKSWAGTCRVVRLKLASDTVTHDAYFKFK